MKKLINFLKESFVWFIVFPAVGFLLWGGLNYTGFCWTEKRWLSNEERIDIAIKNRIKQPTIWLYDGPASSKEYEVIPYKTVEDFKKQNPDCCEIKYFEGFLSSDWTEYYDLVKFYYGLESKFLPVVAHKVLYKDKEKIREHYISKTGGEIPPFEFINNCGKAYNPQQ